MVILIISPVFLSAKTYKGKILIENKTNCTLRNIYDLLLAANYCTFDTCFDCLKDGNSGFFESFVFV